MVIRSLDAVAIDVLYLYDYRQYTSANLISSDSMVVTTLDQEESQSLWLSCTHLNAVVGLGRAHVGM